LQCPQGDMFAAMTELLAKYSKNKSLKCYYSVISSFLLWLPFSSKPIIILLPVYLQQFNFMGTRDASIRLSSCRWNWWKFSWKWKVIKTNRQPPEYSWNIVESDVKHYRSNPNKFVTIWYHWNTLDYQSWIIIRIHFWECFPAC
jgi:hypothetical protein